MSFLNKIKGWGQDRGTGAESTQQAANQQDGFDDAFAHAGAHTHGTMPLEVSTVQQSVAADSSIISEAAPSEMADFSETRIQAGDAANDVGSGLPLIGHRPVADQQKILGTIVAIGLIGLVTMTAVSLNAASKGAAQVGASGQALMQSQRLAKSVSQALIGSPQAFPEVRESTEVLAKNVRGLKNGDDNLNAAPSGVQEALDPMVPLVDRAEKNANTVI